MTKEELATILDGKQYAEVPTPKDVQLAKENNLLIVYGASDDLCEFAGAINDEFDLGYDGRIIDCDELPKLIEAVWNPLIDNCSWAYKTDMPHSEFRIYEDKDLYCVGIVIDLNEVRAKSNAIPSPEDVVKEMLAASQKETEQSHIEMDEIMAKTLEALGYEAAIKIFRKTGKCYI